MHLKYSYPFFHGIIIVVVYSVIKFVDVNASMLLLSISLLIGAFLLLFFHKRIIEFFSRALIIKGVLFGFTQILMYETLIGTSMLNTMISSLFGGVLVTILGFIFLRERINKAAYIGVSLSFLGGLYFITTQYDLFSISFYAIIAGVLQGSTTTLTRSNIKNLYNKESIIFSNFFWGGLIIILYCSFKNFSLNYNVTSTITVIILLLAVLTAQYSLFFMMKFSTTQLSSSLTLSRIPTSLLIDNFFFHRGFNSDDLISTTIIILGATMTVILDKSNQEIKNVNTDSNYPKLNK